MFPIGHFFIYTPYAENKKFPIYTWIQGTRTTNTKKIKTILFEKSIIWRMLNFSTQWNIRDVSRNKIRSLMGIIGVLGCAMLLLTGFGCLDSTNGMIDTMYGQLMTANNKVVFSSDAGYDFA